jgi:hypothetical protein
MEAMFRQLLDDLDRCPLPLTGGQARKSVTDNELKQLFHHVEATGIM